MHVRRLYRAAAAQASGALGAARWGLQAPISQRTRPPPPPPGLRHPARPLISPIRTKGKRCARANPVRTTVSPRELASVTIEGCNPRCQRSTWGPLVEWQDATSPYSTGAGEASLHRAHWITGSEGRPVLKCGDASCRLRLRRHWPTWRAQSAPLCSGSTEDFGSFSPGSNPGGAAMPTATEASRLADALPAEQC